MINTTVTISPSITATPCPIATTFKPSLTITNHPPTPTRIPILTPTNPPSIIPPEISMGNQSKKQIIFTFDGGAGIQSMQEILDTLQKHNIKSTFFTTGTWANQNQEYIKKIASNGHEIFNHTYTHPYLTNVSDEQIISELKRTEDLIMLLTHKSTKPYFRAPYGDRNLHVREIAGKQGYQSIYWTIDALDWKESEGYTAEQVKQRIYTNQRPGAIILMHIGDTITGQILDEVLTKLEGDGYQIVPLSTGIH
jgi:peptidoglycan/xylan/chitin deacetylase (PgdA/CDA1 family)